ncbi:FkbM family methyltransferase, partial [bacterium]|nr:FkbM family methyltransferase [bacterium]
YENFDLKSCDFIKLDAEGHEEKILQGASNFFTHEKPIVMFEIKHGQNYNMKLIEVFKKMDFELFKLESSLNKLIRFQESEIDAFLLNVFAIPHSKVKQLKTDNVIIDPISFTKLESNYLKYFLLENLSYKHLGFTNAVIHNTKVTAPNYWNALNLFCASQDLGMHSDLSYSYLQESYQILKMIASNSPQVAPTLSLIRVALEVRDIQLAMDLTRFFLKNIDNQETLEIDDVFISPNKDYENLSEISHQWLEEQLIQIQESFSSFSSIFQGEASYKRTSKLIALGNHEPMTLRKNILCNFGGTTQHLSPLKSLSKKNLNAKLWLEFLV